MDIYGDCYTGDPFCVQFAPDQIGDEAYIAEIVQRICSLRPLFEEFVVVDLIKKDGDADRPAFFQTTRDRAFAPSPEKRYLFCVEIGIPGIEGKRKGTWLYGKENLSCEEAVRLFYDICVERKKPDLREWERCEHIFCEETTEKKRREKRLIERCKRIYGLCARNKVSGSLHDAILWEALETLCCDSFEYSNAFFDLCNRYGTYVGLQRMTARRPQDAVLSAARGDLIFQGKLSAPDPKSAYDLYVHAARTGSLRAAFNVAKAFRDGWFGPPNMKRYEEIVRSIYEFYIQNNPLCLFTLPEVILELSRIEEKNGNIQEAIEYCLKWREISRMNACNDCYPSEIEGQIVLQLYRLTEFDPADIDLLDLYYILRSPRKAKLTLDGGAEIEVEAMRYENEVIVRCGETYFRTIADFFERYRFNGKRISAYADEISYILMEENQ